MGAPQLRVSSRLSRRARAAGSDASGPWVPEGATAEIGWAILPSEWRRGYASEGARAAIDWAIDQLGWTEINHCIDAGNAASIALAEKLGARWLRSDHDAHGKEVQVYGQTSQQWRSR